MNSDGLKIDAGWTLFLDRDGVINARIVDGYVRNWVQFEFLPGVTDALKTLSSAFQRIIVVSNQQGIGKGLMTEEDLSAVHARMTEEISRKGGRIDRIYHSPYLEEEHSVMRKPNVGMALRARKDFPGIRFSCSVMVGDSFSDMIFGKRLGMVNVYLGEDLSVIRNNPGLIDFRFPDLITFAKSLNAG